MFGPCVLSVLVDQLINLGVELMYTGVGRVRFPKVVAFFRERCSCCGHGVIDLVALVGWSSFRMPNGSSAMLSAI